MEENITSANGNEEWIHRLNEILNEASKEQIFPGQRLGPYEIIHRIGRGGMGTVYLGFHSDEPNRPLAIKLLHPKLLGNKRLRDQFEAELNILRFLQHPYIAELVGSGKTEHGDRYMVLEYVEGQTIDRFCARRRIGIAGRINLFLKVCEAVQYAHENLIIHRDIKPENILVTHEGEPKLLDFGIGKLLRPLEDAGNVSDDDQAGLAAMTPEYASPEHVTGAEIGMDSDVYSLGVLLYGLLTGRPPYNFDRQNMAEVKQVICKKAPVKPSVRLKNHRDPSWRLVRGSLDRIVMKALAKNPLDRYATVRLMAGDLLQNPVSSMPVWLNSFVAEAADWIHRNSSFVVLSGITAAGIGLAKYRKNKGVTPKTTRSVGNSTSGRGS